MKVLGNILWILLGGFATAVEYFTAGIVLMITIIGIPFGLQAIKLGLLMLLPFGSKITEQPNKSGCLSLGMNVIWIIIAGIWISLTHILFGVLLAITIIGIPFAKQHFKFAGLAFTPFGREVKIGGM